MCSTTCFATEQAKNWLHPPNVKDIYTGKYPDIEIVDFYEVVPTKRVTAVSRLKDNKYKNISSFILFSYKYILKCYFTLVNKCL